MPIYTLILLALIQGLTEFLPVSSSGHLVLAHAILDDGSRNAWDSDLLIDVAVHVGTLFSVCVYFWRDIWHMMCGLWAFITGNRSHKGAGLAMYVIISSIPVIIAGFILHAIEPGWIRSPLTMAITTIIFGILLWWVDETKDDSRNVESLTLKDALIIGGSQILALIPGTSRSGITMTAARYMGFSRTEAARYSLLLAIVAISGAGVLGGIDLIQSNNIALTRDVFIAVGLSFMSGLAAIAVMMKFLQNATFKVFGIYRILLGAALLGCIYSGLL